MPGRTVFISYSHDSDEHREKVLALSERLREDGLETRLDQYLNGTPEQGWPRWMLDQLDEADFVLVVCTPTYYRRFRGHEKPGRGKGVDWEGGLITQEIYDARYLARYSRQGVQLLERVLGVEHPNTTISTWNLLQTVRQLNDTEAEAHLIHKLLWLLDRDEASIPSANQRNIRQEMLNLLGST